MAIRRRLNKAYFYIFIVASILLIVYAVCYSLRRRSPTKYMNEKNLSQYGNATWPRKRVPRLIHQTYRTYDVPEVWNRTVQAVMKMNSDDFEYRRWSHKDMEEFVRQREPEFYKNTFVNYVYDMQRIDSFRYALMFHIGGIYIDMDSASKRPLREFVTTLEALDPNSPYLVLFPEEDSFGIQTDFVISTPGHPIFKQFINRLPYFNHYYLLHHITILLSAGPLFASFQERFFYQTDQQVVRILKNKIYLSEFWKTNGGTWFGRDTLIILYLYYNSDQYLGYLKTGFIWLVILFVVFMLFRLWRKHFPRNVTIIEVNHRHLLKDPRRQALKSNYKEMRAD